MGNCDLELRYLHHDDAMTEEPKFLKPCPFCGQSLTFFGHDRRGYNEIREGGTVVATYMHPAIWPPTWNACPLSGLVFDAERWNKRYEQLSKT